MTPIHSGPALRSIVLTLMAIAALACADSAAAATGDLTFQNCIGAISGCTTTNPADTLQGATSLAISPDGKQLYVAGAYNGSEVNHLTIDSSGNLTFDGCIGDGFSDCPNTTTPSETLRGAKGVAISPDGKQLYVTADIPGTLNHFSLDSSGNPTFEGCFGDVSGCTATNPTTLLNDASGVQVSADGKQLYAMGGSALAHFTLDSSGSPTLHDCVGSLTGCTATSPAGAIGGSGPTDLALSADGTQLYDLSSASDIAHLTVDSSGNPTFKDCVGNLSGCTSITPSNALLGSEGLAINAGRSQLYAVAYNGNDVSHLSLDSTGKPTFHGCVGNLSGCTATSPTTALNGASGVALTPDGTQLYVGAYNGGYDVSHLSLDSSGNPTFQNCVGDLTGCAATTPAGALIQAWGVAVNPTGTQLYVAGYTVGGDVSHLSIEHPSTPKGTSPPTITITTPANGAHYKQGQRVLAFYFCTYTNAQPAWAGDITLCAGPAQDGAPIDTSTPGSHSFTVQAADKFGNTSKKTVHYTVDTTVSSPPVVKGFPQNEGCVPKGLKLNVSVHPTGLKQVLVSLDGTAIASSKKPKFKVKIAASGLSPGRHKIRIERDYKSGTKRHSTFSFTTCKGGGKSPHIRTQGTPDQGSCTAKPFKIVVTITGAKTSTIAVKLDAKKVKTPAGKSKFTLSIDTTKLKPGAHRLTIMAADKHKNSSVSVTNFVRCG